MHGQLRTATRCEVVAASDLNQQLGQGFAGDSPPDLFYMGWDQFRHTRQRLLEPYARDLSNTGDFYPTRCGDAFTYDGDLLRARRRTSRPSVSSSTPTCGQAAGLTDADVPTDWDGLEAAAKKLTTGDTVGLSFGLEYARIGVFMNQAGGHDRRRRRRLRPTPAVRTCEGLEYVRELHRRGQSEVPASSLKRVGRGEALGLGKAAMVIEGPWIKGALRNDFPDMKYVAL